VLNSVHGTTARGKELATDEKLAHKESMLPPKETTDVHVELWRITQVPQDGQILPEIPISPTAGLSRFQGSGRWHEVQQG
jgi:hypothetical protein